MIDPENVRVDLLKFRQKAYLSYPEGSLERRNFLKTILENELRLVEQDFPQEMVDLVLKGHDEVLWTLIKQSSLWVLIALSCGTFFALMHKYTIFSYMFLFYMGCALYILEEKVRQYLKFNKRVKELQKYSSDVTTHINKIIKDIKRLEGPRGI